MDQSMERAQPLKLPGRPSDMQCSPGLGSRRQHHPLTPSADRPLPIPTIPLVFSIWRFETSRLDSRNLRSSLFTQHPASSRLSAGCLSCLRPTRQSSSLMSSELPSPCQNPGHKVAAGPAYSEPYRQPRYWTAALYCQPVCAPFVLPSRPAPAASSGNTAC